MDREPPQAIESEQALLDCILQNGEGMALIADQLRPEDFYLTAHQHIYRASLDLFNNGKPTDMLSVADRLKSQGKLEEAGGASKLSSIHGSGGYHALAENYAQKIRDTAALRRVIEFCRRTELEAHNEHEDVGAFQERVSSEISGLLVTAPNGSYSKASDIYAEVCEKVRRINEEGQGASGLLSGYDRLDMITLGFRPGELSILAARPSIGKSALAIAIAGENSFLNKKHVAFFSLEMSAQSLIERLVAQKAEIDTRIFQGQPLDPDKQARLDLQKAKFEKAPLYICDNGRLTITGMKARARRIKAEHGLDLIVVDYLQLLSLDKRGRTREEEISNISRELKALAQSLHVPILALSQLNREVEKRSDKRPLMSDLRESGALEQDADVVMLLHRPAKYDPSADPQLAELAVAKNRNGRCGEVKLKWLNFCAKFKSWEEASTRTNMEGTDDYIPF
jgi:replicative DNA helicase